MIARVAMQAALAACALGLAACDRAPDLRAGVSITTATPDSPGTRRPPRPPFTP